MADPYRSNRRHDYDDLDQGKKAHHHTLGQGRNQAAPGDHDHSAIEAFASRTDIVGSITGSEVTLLSFVVPQLVRNRRYLFLAHCRCQSTVAGDEVTFRMYLGGNQIVGHPADLRAANRDTSHTVLGTYLGTGERNITIDFRIFRSAGSGTISTVAAATSPTRFLMQ